MTRLVVGDAEGGGQVRVLFGYGQVINLPEKKGRRRQRRKGRLNWVKSSVVQSYDKEVFKLAFFSSSHAQLDVIYLLSLQSTTRESFHGTRPCTVERRVRSSDASMFLLHLSHVPQ